MLIPKAPRRIRLKEVEVNGFCSTQWPPTKDSTFLRPGQGHEGVVPLFDSVGCAMLCRHVNSLVYPVPKEVGNELFA